jgi:hypothetical protein
MDEHDLKRVFGITDLRSDRMDLPAVLAKHDGWDGRDIRMAHALYYDYGFHQPWK